MPRTHISLTCDRCCIILLAGRFMEFKCLPSLEKKSFLITGYIPLLEAFTNNKQWLHFSVMFLARLFPLLII